MYSRQIDGQEYTFGVSGKLIMNVLVMYDRQTKTLWSQLLGEAVEGPLKGTKLEYLPSWQTTWAEWKTLHPDTLALRKGYYGSRDPYFDYYDSDRSGVIGQAHRDDRLYVKEFVIGVALDDLAVAYPFSVLNDQPVINDNLGDTPLLVVFDEESATGVVFNRRLEGQTLTFESAGDDTLRDQETGSLWNKITGEALDGPLAGQHLNQVKSTSSFWFGWKDFYPQTRVYGLDEQQP